MTPSDLNRLRLHNQQIDGGRFTEAAALVSWMGGLQAQDYPHSLWAIACRVPGLTAAAVEQAISSRSIIRTWPMRGTLHWVAAADIRWLLTLLAPRLIAANATRYRQLELDARTLHNSQHVLARVLAGGNQLTRQQLTQAFNQAGINVAGQRLYHILQRAGLDQLICFGTRQDKEFTYTLLDEWAPAGKTLAREEALAELARRYFHSRGPATLADFGWWSGLAAAEARAALEMVKPGLQATTGTGQEYWWPAAQPEPTAATSPGAYLLAGFEEYILGYKNRSTCLDNKLSQQVVLRTGIIHPLMVLDGQVVGTWKRRLKKDVLVVETTPLQSLNEADRQAFAAEAGRYARFMDK